MQQHPKSNLFSAAFIFLAGISAVGLLIPRENGTMLFMGFFTAFFGYVWLCRAPLPGWWLLILGVGARLLLWVDMPSLSEDVYRFLWDGALLQNGISPFGKTPTEWMQAGLPAGLTSELYQSLNSPLYPSVYPPLNQLIFWVMTSLTESQLAATNLLRGLLLLSDIGSWWLLTRLLSWSGEERLSDSWFFLNPLLILEVTGNVHLEGLVIFFVLLGIWLWERNRHWLAGGSLGLAAATKLVPLLFVPAFLFSHFRKKGWRVATLALVVFTLSMIPVVLWGVAGLGSGLNLYFQKFEFNASVYFLLRQVGFWLKGYNVIGFLGPALSLLAGVLIVWSAFLGSRRGWPLPEVLLWSLTIYLTFATTVHPWYILPLVPLGVLAGYWFPLVWSLMSFVSYLGYTATGYELSGWWLVLEYGVVWLVLLIEVNNRENIR